MHQIIPTAEPFLLPGDPSRPGCLLIHGFTGTPKEMRWMGEFLNGEGHTCLGVRLAGHATDPEDMVRSRYTDWMASVEEGYHLLRGVADRIYLIGLSMGGILSLLMASRLDVNGVVAMSTPSRLPTDYPIWFLQLVSLVLKYRRKSSGPPGSGWFDRDAYRSHISYPGNPVRSSAELKKLIREMHATLPSVKVPVLLMHSKDDTYVLPDNTEEIFARLVNSRDKTRLYIEGSGHVLPRDAARAEVFQHALEFIQRVEAQQSQAPDLHPETAAVGRD